jgi:hypothetical protein
MNCGSDAPLTDIKSLTVSDDKLDNSDGQATA